MLGNLSSGLERSGAIVSSEFQPSILRTLLTIFSTVIAVPDAETQFDIDEFNDLYARTKPTLYIKMADIFSVHHLVAAETMNICPNQDDMLRDAIRELGSAKTNENELMNVSTSEICLTLNPKLHDVEGMSHLCSFTKRISKLIQNTRP